MGLAVHFVAQFLDQAGALQVGTGIRDEGSKEAQIVLVELIELFIAIQSHQGSYHRVVAHERRHDRRAAFPRDRVVAGPSVL